MLQTLLGCFGQDKGPGMEFDALFDDITALLQNGFAGASDFFDQDRGQYEFKDPSPNEPPRGVDLAACIPLANDLTRPLVTQIAHLSDRLNWQQTYTQADGFSRDFLNNYAWLNVISPDGMFMSDTARVTIGYWGQGLQYPEHSHAPEEIYCILAGSATFHSEGQPARVAGAGEMIHHMPHQKHAIDMTPGPLLALIPWRGEGLNTKSDLG